MRLVIFHHHLNPGGVTRIIKSQIDGFLSLLPESSILLFTGNCPDKNNFKYDEVDLVENSDLDYLEIKKYDKASLEQKYINCYKFIKIRLKPNDVIHLHNINLGKNPILTLVFYNLAKEGYYIFNHCHDFAEDRPENLDFLSSIIEDGFDEDVQVVLYPFIDNYKYGTLNSFDFNRLGDFGIPVSRRVLVPNPIEFKNSIETIDINNTRKNICKQLHLDPGKKIVTYPVRVIKRKNIGELILFSILFKNEATFVVTQPPKNPLEKNEYNSWKKFCEENKVNVVFEAGEKVDFEELIAVSDFCITTSYREGFGMAYLESWIMETPVIGRKIEYVCNDLVKEGLILDRLYDTILVEFANEKQDFKDLEICEQRDFLVHIRKNDCEKDLIFELNPVLKNILSSYPEKNIFANKKIVQTKYSKEKYGERLYEIYRTFS